MICESLTKLSLRKVFFLQYVEKSIIVISSKTTTLSNILAVEDQKRRSHTRWRVVETRFERTNRGSTEGIGGCPVRSSRGFFLTGAIRGLLIKACQMLAEVRSSVFGESPESMSSVVEQVLIKVSG